MILAALQYQDHNFPIQLRDGQGEGKVTLTIMSDNVNGRLFVYQRCIKFLQATPTKILSH